MEDTQLLLPRNERASPVLTLGRLPILDGLAAYKLLHTGAEMPGVAIVVMASSDHQAGLNQEADSLAAAQVLAPQEFNQLLAIIGGLVAR